ncbi:AAA domain protein [anaerobic digester metagenome]
MEEKEVAEPDNWDPIGELVTYLTTLFEADDFVGYVTQSFLQEDGSRKPGKGNFKRTAGELISEIQNCKGDIGAVLGDYDLQTGAWIRFNPLDGQGVKNSNVTDFRYALVESDNMELDKQNALLRELELPIACLVHSGKKSLHAIVKIDAGSYDEYRKRVDYLYDVCRKNGLDIDRQNRNPSRLSRMPGVTRSGKKQYLIDTNIGKSSWNEWHEWVEGINDDLPDPEGLTDIWDNLPELAPPLIDGVLRQGHKMLMAGPSKAGKSFALIELCIAIAEGRSWMGWQCTRGRVLYVNLELDRASCLHRFRDVYEALGWSPDHVANIDIWNLRGKTMPMDKLAPKLIRRALKKKYTAVMIDPIYKVITGDENAADQMAHFTNQFDKICTEIGSSVIYCHHHSKGNQGHKKAMDRASGSGVFARDPDALLDLTELEVTDALLKQEENKAICKVYADIFRRDYNKYYMNDISQDDMLSAAQMKMHADRKLTLSQQGEAAKAIEQAKAAARMKTAWRIDGTLREFPKFEPVNFWFDYPLHTPDTTGALKDLEPEGEKPPWVKAIDKRKTPEQKKESRINELEIAYSNLEIEGEEEITLSMLEDELEIKRDALKKRIKEHGGFDVVYEPGKESKICRKETPSDKT